MPLGSIGLAEGATKYLHAWYRNISSVDRYEQYIQQAEPVAATYVVVAPDVPIGTASAHAVQIMSGASTYTRIHDIYVRQSGTADTAQAATFALYRLSSAGTGGTAITPAPYDTADTASATAAYYIGTATKGTETTMLNRFTLNLMETVPTTNAAPQIEWRWSSSERCKPIIIPSGTGNGIALKVGTADTLAKLNIVIEFTETAYL